LGNVPLLPFPQAIRVELWTVFPHERKRWAPTVHRGFFSDPWVRSRSAAFSGRRKLFFLCNLPVRHCLAVAQNLSPDEARLPGPTELGRSLFNAALEFGPATLCRRFSSASFCMTCLCCPERSSTRNPLLWSAGIDAALCAKPGLALARNLLGPGLSKEFHQGPRFRSAPNQAFFFFPLFSVRPHFFVSGRRCDVPFYALGGGTQCPAGAAEGCRRTGTAPYSRPGPADLKNADMKCFAEDAHGPAPW